MLEITKYMQLNNALAKFISALDDNSNLRFLVVADKITDMEYVKSYVPHYHHYKVWFVPTVRVVDWIIHDVEFSGLLFINGSQDKLNTCQIELILSKLSPSADIYSSSY